MVKRSVSVTLSFSAKELLASASSIARLGASSATVELVGDAAAIKSAVTSLSEHFGVVSARISLRGDRPAK